MIRRASLSALLCIFIAGGLALGGCSHNSSPGSRALTIDTASPLHAGTLGGAYSQQFQASGGTSPYQWALAAGSTLPPGLTLSASGLLSGNTTAQGTTTFSVTVTDSEVPPVSFTKSFKLSVNNLLTGNYAFVFNGFNVNGAVVAAGSFTADGQGNITAGFEDSNSIQGPPAGHSFTGTYTIGSDNRGTLVFSSLTGSPTYTFAIDSTALHGLLIEFDSTGTRGSGELAQQSVATCGSATIAGSAGDDFVIGATGSAAAFLGVSTAGPVVFAGRFTAEPPAVAGQPGSLNNGQADVNIPGIPVTNNPLTLTGNFNTTSQAARCTLTVTPGTIGNLTFSIYPISTKAGLLTEAFLVETDTVSSTTPYITAGRIMQQEGYPFANAEGSFSATSVAGLNGEFLSGSAYLPDVAIVSLTGTGASSFTIAGKENQAGTIGVFGSPFSSSFINSSSSGRIDTSPTTPFAPVFYVIGPNEALCIGELTSNPFFGIFEPQSKGGTATVFSASTVAGTLLEGTLPPPSSASRDISGVVTLAGATAATGTVSGTQDQSTQSVNASSQNITGTYALTGTGASDGSGTITLTQPLALTGSFFIVSPTKIVMITTTAADVNPVLITLGEQTDNFGLN